MRRQLLIWCPLSRSIVKPLLWLLIMSGALFAFLLTGGGNHKLSTDLMALLPMTEQDQAASDATDLFARRFGSKVLFLVSSEQRDVARKSALKLEALLREDGCFASLEAQRSIDQWKAIADFYYPWRYVLLGEQDRQLTDKEFSEQIVNRTMSRLSGLSGFVSPSQLIHDPLFQLQDFFQSLSRQAGNLAVDDGMLTARKDGVFYVLVTGTLNESQMSLDYQDRIVNSIKKNIAATTQMNPGVHILPSGMVFYAKAGADSARSEVSTIGLGSMLGVVLLIVLIFRAATPLYLCVLSIASGVVFGFLVTASVFNQVHLLTLVFGASLIGVSIDYAFHYLAEQLRQGVEWNPVKGLKHILPGLSFGLITSLLGYFPMLVTPFPGLQQMAVFSSAGLLAAWLTVVLIYPFVLKKPNTSGRKLRVPLLLVDGLLGFWRNIGDRGLAGYLMAGLVLLGAGALFLESDDDIRQLQNRSVDLVENDARLQEIVGSSIDNRFFLVRGSTPQELLERTEQLSLRLSEQVEAGHLTGYSSLSNLLPSVVTQKENYRKVAKVFELGLPDIWQNLGISDKARASALSAFQSASGQWLKPDNWLSNPIAQIYDYLWLGKHGNDYFSPVILMGAGKNWNPEDMTKLSGVEYVDKTTETSKLFGAYRVLMGWLLLVAYGVITVLLAFRYGVRGAVRAVMPPVTSVLLTLSLLAVLGQPVNLFHILALLMVLGIGIDYTLFFMEAGNENRYTLLAISLSAITTILSFGLLSLSETAAVSSFGLTILMGILFCYLLSPFAINRRPGDA